MLNIQLRLTSNKHVAVHDSLNNNNNKTNNTDNENNNNNNNIISSSSSRRHADHHIQVVKAHASRCKVSSG